MSALKNAIFKSVEFFSGETVLVRFIKVVVIYVSAYIFMYLACFLFGFIHQFPSANALVKWDAGFYASIANEGYKYYWFRSSNSGFFPLFPYVWRFLGLGDVGISAFNFATFLLGFYLLFKTFKVKSIYALCYISIPSLLFFFLPFTESLFFLFSAVLLVGLAKNRMYLILTGLFFCSLTRATAMFFIPAIICMELFNSERFFSKQAIKNILLYSFVSLAGLFIVVLVQYYQTYEWFAFAKVQTKFYHHKFTLPHFPLISYAAGKILLIDGIAFFFGILSLMMTLTFFVKFIKKQKHPMFNNRPFWFSATYIFMIAVYCLFFNEKNAEGNTSLMSINRYLFCTAFFFIFFIEALKNFEFNLKTGSIYFVIGFVVWVSLGFGTPIDFLTGGFESQHKTTLFFAGMSIYTLLFYFLISKRYREYAGATLFCLNMLFSVYLFYSYITNNWVA